MSNLETITACFKSELLHNQLFNNTKYKYIKK